MNWLILPLLASQCVAITPAFAPDGKTVPIVNAYVRMVGEDNKWVRLEWYDCKPFWRYAKLVSITIPEHTEQRFEEIDP